jgi:HTH-type transcriptional regulator/antitoxin HigA
MTHAQIDKAKKSPPLRRRSKCLTPRRSIGRWLPCSTALVDEVGEDENHPLAWMMEVIGVLIEKYEDEHVPEIGAKTSRR